MSTRILHTDVPEVVAVVPQVPKLKVIVAGLMAGMQSVVYILVLMIIVFYIYAALGVSLW